MIKPATGFAAARICVFCSCSSGATDFVTSSSMIDSSSRENESDKLACWTNAIKPEMKGGKQLNDGIDDTFVFSVRGSFLLIDDKLRIFSRILSYPRRIGARRVPALPHDVSRYKPIVINVAG